MSSNSSKSSRGSKGNTNQNPRVKKAKKSQIPTAHAWCFTFNNYVEADIPILIDTFIKNDKLYIFGEEVGGKCGTPHLQGYVYDKHKKWRWDMLKLNNTIHWERAKGDVESNIKYCSKDGKYHCSPALRPLNIIKELYPWQRDILNIYHTTPDDRAIYWIYDSKGGKGKSSFQKFLAYHFDILFLNAGDNKNIANMVYMKNMRDCKCIFLDICRSKGNKCPYAVMECIKNGIITNTKFETGNKIFNPPHIFITSNFRPDTSALSKDRWNIYKINENMELVKEGLHPLGDALDSP